MKPTTLSPELRRRSMIFGGSALSILVIAAIASYFILGNNKIAIDTAAITAPLITLSPTSSGRLNAIYVHEGDRLLANSPVALVGTEVLSTKVAGLIVQVQDTIGAQVTPGSPVVEMIDPTQLRVVGRVDETKGLAQIQIGDPITFTVDAFGGQSFTGLIDDIAPTSNQSGIVFNISSQRQTQQFDIKARFDINAYPQLKNGMSVRMVIYTK